MRTYFALAALTLAPATLFAQYPPGYPGRPAPPRIGGAQNGTVPVARMFNPVSGDHVWTTDGNEIDTLLFTRTWALEGPAFQLNPGPAEGLVPLYRVYWPLTGDHSLATAPPGVLPPEARPEGILGYASAEARPGLVPLFGFRNKYGREFFTIDPNGEAVTRRSQRFVIGYVQPPQ